MRNSLLGSASEFDRIKNVVIPTIAVAPTLPITHHMLESLSALANVGLAGIASSELGSKKIASSEPDDFMSRSICRPEILYAP